MPAKVAPRHYHHEHHFNAPETVRDIVLGMSDGLTVPFALAAGLAGVAASSRIVVTAGLAEIIAGAISMGLGGYLAARTDIDHYASEEKREYDETHELPGEERAEVAKIFKAYGLADDQVSALTTAISSDRKRWVDFMMRFELGLEKPDERRAPRSAATIAASYAVGGLIPLAPYVVIGTVGQALLVSVIVTLIALLVFGALKSRATGTPQVAGALQTGIVGALAAGVAFLLARLVAGGGAAIG